MAFTTRTEVSRLLQRREKGFSLVEMLVSTVIVSIAMMLVGSFFYLNSNANQRISNKIDAVTQAYSAIERIGLDMRMASSLGDQYGYFTTTVGVVGPPYDWTCVETWWAKTFPSPADPIWGTNNNGNGGYPPNGQSPAGWSNTWPVWADGSSPTTFTLGSDTLVLQVPVFDFYGPGSSPSFTLAASGFPAASCNKQYVGGSGPYGFPTLIPANAVAAPVGSSGKPGFPQSPVPNLETHIYRVVPDPANAGQFLLQYCKLPGWPVYMNDTLTNGLVYDPSKVSSKPETIVSGIIGPFANSTSYTTNGNVPSVFQYLNSGTTNAGSGGIQDFTALAAATSTTSPNDSSIVSSLTGVVINMEIKKSAYSVGTKSATTATQKAAYLPIKAEVFLRNNAQASYTGQ